MDIDRPAEAANGDLDQVTSHRIDFHHPYTPYDIQETFMNTVYQVLEGGKVGILESPTGTVRLIISLIHKTLTPDRLLPTPLLVDCLSTVYN